MKRMFFLALVLASCGNGRNELMTSLVNKKKALEDSTKDALNREHYYYQQAREKMRDADTGLWKRLADTSTMYSMKGRDFDERLKAVSFSIDSLEKMK